MLLLLAGLLLSAADAPPLPDIQTIKRRAMQRARQQAKDLERYSCDVTETQESLKADGSVKDTTTREFDRFFVGGYEVNHLLKKNGKSLSPNEVAKEQQRVDKLVRQDSDSKRLEKKERENSKEVDAFLRAVRFTNGHRETREGRSLVVYDLSGDPSFKPSDLSERFAQALVGRIWIDETTSNPVEMDFRTERDVKVAGGLANVHKGFRLHVTQQLVDGNVWIEKSVDARGDGRAIFSTIRLRSHEVVNRCRVYKVESQSTTEKPK